MCYWVESTLLRHYLIYRSQLKEHEQANLSGEEAVAVRRTMEC